MSGQVRHLEASLLDDFFRFHCDANQGGWCHCVAWWVATWEGWGDRTAAQNRELREQLFARGELDGYLLYEAGEPVGWCQVGPRDRLEKLRQQFALEPDPQVWAITCFLIAPRMRGFGHASKLLDQVLEDLRGRGVRFVEAYPKRGTGLTPLDLWTGPESMFRRRAFQVVHDDPARPVLSLDLGLNKEP